MKYLSNKKGFLGTDNAIGKEEKVVVVPFGLEKTVSYGGGTSKGPKEIIKASHQVELFDEDLNKEPYKHIGIKTLKPFPIKKNIIDALKQIENINKILLDKKKFSSLFKWKKKRMQYSMGLFVYYFGTKKTYKDIEHHTIKFGNKYKEHLDDIFDKLDDHRILKLISFVDKNVFGQVFITDTHAERSAAILTKAGITYSIYKIENGNITNEGK